MLNCTAIADELLFESECMEGSIFNKVGSKLYDAEELLGIVHAEGWPLDFLDPAKRVDLAYRVLEKMKVVQENEAWRLEFHTYAEKRMLKVVMDGGMNRPEINVGVIEINQHITLHDLRALLTHEMDREVLPKLYRFFYKGGTCAVYCTQSARD